uniref:Uncharacterized protein n=1 Tax=virus sp. ct1Uu26 TaxID=2826789 RepID=A0A8S5R8P5_9VIRU|nr:MAG TPA: hypothetical protein [virus sp. ct1Uu26]DAQ88688.1 MAG TPA: hypothetical protein [Caudoviricetes sp.]
MEQCHTSVARPIFERLSLRLFSRADSILTPLH